MGLLAACGQAATAPAPTPAPTGLTSQEEKIIASIPKADPACVAVVEELELPDGSYVHQGAVFHKTIRLRLFTPITGKTVRFYRAIINGAQTQRPDWAPEEIVFPGSRQSAEFSITPQLRAPVDFSGRVILLYAFGDKSGNFCGAPLKIAAIVVGP